MGKESAGLKNRDLKGKMVGRCISLLPGRGRRWPGFHTIRCLAPHGVRMDSMNCYWKYLFLPFAYSSFHVSCASRSAKHASSHLFL
ncbi:MAG: hypothetical protein MRK01_05545 [Candidatus Scalindua sp.]|nr:hypothetical protein [Candidatus Scalindua sp.]